ncbi:hypothetical protein HUA74_00525 [Myxococcus sp. CA051A]|uniref:Outer membrane protein beta-barrel domain-containing protein n=1 Tax=Myxococcus llanfairpwllgwyngyllgogerychwyrndrobwllllantysiliogogogochensis TaxID=2590453 RepID=A0A540WWL3_9BACT|nr:MULTISPECIES: hypothetical protein [Myxococcus]NTX00560.1 hypothetical protein [Myxococcus sp. CA040A]NTX12737.1 hypothetical protein [Myxococcus sp. CA056]NTX33756.1 hypothetical protein [Myxococcus sp. CA033]NTX57757.1 hypothetical protein [Myxococcus sp. CA039A]NTX59137.1 hypothetical protein [Myxococcus sp. CA051A]
MRTFSRWLALAACVSGATAYADDNDLRIADFGDPKAMQGGALTNAAANANFRAFARVMGAAITSANLMPPETTGHSAWAVNAELSVVSLPDSVRIPTENPEQPSTVLIPSFHVRKGLPFSLELGGRVGWVEKSSQVVATGEVKWAVNEGFTWLPDVGLRGHVTKLFGARDLSLTVMGLDIGVGKQFPLGGMVTLTPYGGLDLGFVGATTSRLDFDPSRSYEDSTVGDSRGALTGTDNYAKVSFGDNVNQRIYGGVRFIGGVLQLGAELSLTRTGSVETPRADNPNALEDRGLPAVFAFSTTLGLDF